MTRRTTALILGLAALAGGCTVAPHHDDVRVYPSDRYVVHEHDTYEGYYYVRIVYLRGEPWYVDDDLHARPLPPHLRSHFRYGAWSRSLPPSFGRDGMRDGYRLSRIVYVDGVPHQVDDGRHARPLPSRLRSRFAYESVAWQDDRRRGPAEPMAPPFARGGDAPRPPAYGRTWEDRSTPRADPAPGRGMPPGYMRDDERPGLSAYERAPQPPATGNGALGRAAERAREAARASANPPAARPPIDDAARMPGNGMPSERMRAERRGPQGEAGVPVRAPGRDAPQGVAQRDREQSAADARERGRAERRGEPSAKHNGKGRGRADGEETDSAEARDDGPRGRNLRDD